MIITTNDRIPDNIIESLKETFPMAQFEPNDEISLKIEPKDSFLQILKNAKLDLADPILEAYYRENPKFVGNNGFFISGLDGNITNLSTTFNIGEKLSKANISFKFSFGTITKRLFVIKEERYWDIQYYPFDNLVLHKGKEIKHTDNNLVYYISYTSEIVDSLVSQGYSVMDLLDGKLFNICNSEIEFENIKNILTLQEMAAY